MPTLPGMNPHERLYAKLESAARCARLLGGLDPVSSCPLASMLQALDPDEFAALDELVADAQSAHGDFENARAQAGALPAVRRLLTPFLERPFAMRAASVFEGNAVARSQIESRLRAAEPDCFAEFVAKIERERSRRGRG
jgi:hypothetical protein